MNKNEIIRELLRFNPALIARLFIVYHNTPSNVRYTFTYEKALTYNSANSHEKLKELARVLLSLYKLRRHIKCLRVVYWVPTSENDWLERHYDSCSNHVYSVSDFIKAIKK